MEIPLQSRPGDAREMAPDQAVTESAGLQLRRRLARAVAKRRIDLRQGRGGRIEPVEIGEADPRRQAVVEGVLGVAAEIRRPVLEALQLAGQLRIGVGAGDDEQAHLKAPVAEVGVAQHLLAEEAPDPLDRLADDRRAQVTDVHLLGHIGSGVVDDDPAGALDRPDAGPFVAREGVGAQAEGRVRHGDVDESRPRDLDPLDRGIPPQALGDLARDLSRVALQGLGRREGAVALEVGEVRTIGGRHPPIADVEAESLESVPGALAETRPQIGHGWAAATRGA